MENTFLRRLMNRLVNFITNKTFLPTIRNEENSIEPEKSLTILSSNDEDKTSNKNYKEKRIVKTIYILWLQGFENAPYLVKKCLDSWIRLNPLWNIVQLDENNLENFISISDIVGGLEDKDITNAAMSDLIRISLLNKYGGLWVDATTYCTKPLDDWLEEYVKEGYFSFSYNELPDQKPDRPVASWFIYGERNNYIVKTWFNKTVEYWSHTKKIGNNKPVSTLERWKQGDNENHYFWFHYLFRDIYESDLEFKHIWDAIPKQSETGPHFIQRKGMLNDVTTEVKRHIDFIKSPLYKLTYRYDTTKYTENSNLHYLLEPDYFEMEIASSYYKVKNCIPNIWLIHVGKCGGTALRIFFKDQGINLNDFHLVKPKVDENLQYIIWVRNPLKRFVSAFNHSYELINCDISKLDINNLTIYNTLAPGRIKYRMQHDHTFSKEYDSLINYFQTANNLAEALSSTSSEIRDKAFQLMHHPLEHIYKGLGWYLDNGEFVKNHNEKILFVGRVEAMTEDTNKLSDLLGISLKNTGKIRENNSQYDKSLSPLAIENLLKFYQHSDYKSLKELNNKGWIDNATYESYFTY